MPQVLERELGSCRARNKAPTPSIRTEKGWGQEAGAALTSPRLVATVAGGERGWKRAVGAAMVTAKTPNMGVEGTSPHSVPITRCLGYREAQAGREAETPPRDRPDAPGCAFIPPGSRGQRKTAAPQQLGFNN